MGCFIEYFTASSLGDICYCAVTVFDRNPRSMRDRKVDILIGDNRWIEFISLNGRHDFAVDIDQYMVGLWPLIERLETNCVADCCGFGAFNFTANFIHAMIDGLDCAELLAACDQAQRDITNVASSVVVSNRMNNLSDKRVMLRLIEHIQNCIHSHAN
ncbi:MAG: hypothetical protein KDA78_03080 [Planctomycetaceae bacterium]|nr:hypothetical protein [Planctomycetaceae bacterium]